MWFGCLLRLQLERCVKAGHDVRGVMYWSLVDNFEWAFGFSMKVGGGSTPAAPAACCCLEGDSTRLIHAFSWEKGWGFCRTTARCLLPS